MKARIKFIALLVLAVYVFLPNRLLAQNILYEVPTIESRNSIIRNIPGKDCYVIYNEFKTTRQFIYYKPGISNVSVADFSGANVSVTDMEIIGEDLFFCGISELKPVFGRFKIQQVFAGTGSIQLCPVDAYVIDTATQTYEKLTYFSHIEVQKKSNNDIHLYMIADAYNYLGTTVSNNYRCLVDVWDTGGTTISAYSQEQFSGIYYFNDLAITNNELVVVGDYRGGIGQYMHRYTLPPAMTQTIFPPATTPIPYWYIPDNEFYPIPEATIEHIHDSTFAVASRGIVSSSSSGIALTIYRGIGNPIDRILIDDPDYTFRIKDLRFNPFLQALSLLPDWQYTGCTNNHYLIGLLSSFTIANVNTITPPIPKLHSLDYQSNQIAMVSGDSMDSLYLWQSSLNFNNMCVKHEPELYSHYEASERLDEIRMDVHHLELDYRDFLPTVTTENIYFICK